MNPDRSLLLFPLLFTRLRKSRSVLQKSAAVDFGVDPTVLCGIEKGTRGPFDDEQIKRACEVFQLSDEEVAQLLWAAHHDRLVSHLANKGASQTEVTFVSTGLQALRHLQPHQISGLIASLQQINKSASLVASLGKTNPLLEVAMT